MTIFGIDVSRYQGPVDWAKVKAAGVSFATIKASEGVEVETSVATRDYFRREFPRARAAGLVVGAYHVVRSSDTAGQVDWFLRQLASVNARPADVVLQWDYEKWEYDFPSYAKLKACIGELARRTGRRGILYTGRWVWDQVPGDPADAEADLKVPLWNSSYGTNPNVGFKLAYPGDTSTRWGTYGGWPSVSILQYGSKTVVPGVSGGCDANAYRGTLAQLKSLLLGSSGGTVDLNPDQNIPLRSDSWMREHYKNRPGVLDGLTTRSCLTEGWGFGERAALASESADKHAASILAGQAAILAKQDAILAAIRDQGAAVIARIQELAPVIAQAVADQVDHTLDVDAAAEAIRTVLGAVDGATPPAS